VSAIGVVVDRRGRPIRDDIVSALEQSLRHRAPDGIDIERGPAWAVVFGRLHATPESTFERQPHRMRDGGVLVADLRIDNRAELARAIGWGHPLSSTSDVQLLAAGIERQGIDVASRLVGDFAFAVLRPDGSIVLGRDHLGVKPLHYWATDDWIVVGSELRQVVAHPEVAWRADTGVMGEILSGMIETSTRSSVDGVCRLPAAHVGEIGPTGVELRRYWAPRLDEPIELVDRDACVEEVRAVLEEAVRCRMRTNGPTGSELSGGLDSSSVAAFAAQQQAGLPVRTCVFPYSSRADESVFVRAVTESVAVDWSPIEDEGTGAPFVWAEAAFSLEAPIPPDGPAHVALCRSLREAGCRAVLTGHGGDHWFDAAPVIVTELFDRRRWLDAWRYAGSWGGGRSQVVAMAEGALHRRIPWWAHGRHGPRAPMVRGAARRGAALDRRRAPGRLPRQFGNRRAQHNWELCFGGHTAALFEMLDRQAAGAGVEYRHPYFDRRLVELVARLPIDLVAGPGSFRWLQRAVVRDWLPESVVERRSKASFREVWWNAVETHLNQVDPAGWRVVEAGWVDLDLARGAIEESRHAIVNDVGPGPLFNVWGLIQGEAIVRAIERGR
jgi:asparagine synthase (glutamine-hydrolysing)